MMLFPYQKNVDELVPRKIYRPTPRQNRINKSWGSGAPEGSRCPFEAPKSYLIFNKILLQKGKILHFLLGVRNRSYFRNTIF